MKLARARKRSVVVTCFATLALGACGCLGAQERYPSRPIEFVVPWGPGGGADQLARKIAPGLP